MITKTNFEKLSIEKTPDAILVTAPDGTAMYWNAEVEALFEKASPEEVAGLWPNQISELERQTAIEQGDTEHEDWRVDKDGKQLWVNAVIAPLFDKGGCLQGFTKITRDTTESKRAESILKNKNLELQNAALLKNKFLANMSHELRTPLNGIIGFAEFLVDGKPGSVNERQKEYLQDILNSGRHLLQLINDVLDLAKVEAGKMTFEPEVFSVEKAIAEVCAVTKPLAQKKGIRIEVLVAPEVDCVTLDQHRFKQAIYNLLSNAIKFTDRGGKAKIEVAMRDSNRFYLVVQDTGIGIKTDNISRLFKEYEQLEAGAAHRFEGTGLGLALTRKIVEMQGGEIAVESVLGKGSSFTIVLPLFMPNDKSESSKQGLEFLIPDLNG
jgi:PAS domain S-box-containing protein